MTKIAICYWGMTRSTKFVYNSHMKNLYNVLKNNNIEYKIFMHTWEIENNIIAQNICNIHIDYQEYNLLNPDVYKIEKQNEFINNLNFKNYFDENLYKTYGDNPQYEWKPQLIRNHLCALESQKRVYNLVLDDDTKYDFIMFIRPDVQILNEFNVNWLKETFDIIIPNTDHNEGLNDRFAILPLNKSLKYSTRIDEIIEFRKNNGRIVSEKYVKYIIDKYYSNCKLVSFIMKIIRPNGSELLQNNNFLLLDYKL
jgi:hypothetical protein